MRVIIVLTCALLAFLPASPRAWGMDVHRLVTARALDGLPTPLRAFFAPERAFVVEHSVDPDLWRIVGLRGELGAEDPNHFLDIDDLDEPAPFTGVPRDWAAFLARYGEARATRAGRLPWRMTDIYGRLVDSFKGIGTGTSAYATSNTRYLSAVIAHYMGDAFVPFHAVANYDGQLTNQRGVHARFETELVKRYWARLPQRPVTVAPIPDLETFVFDTLIEGARLTPATLDADRKAAAGKTVYDEAYYARFYEGVRPILEARLTGAANGIASVIVAAWTDAGKPDLTPRQPGQR
jgi:hypothetical protein